MYENIETILALLGIVAVIAGYLAWREIKEAGDNMAEYDARVKAWGEKQTDEDRQAREDHRARLAAYNDTEHEACASMEPFCGDAHTRSREAVARAQKAARDSLKKP